MTALILGYRPFLDPIDANGVWWLMLPPLALLIAVVYKALRLPSLKGYAMRVLVMAAQIVVAMILLGAGAYLLIQHIAPLILPVRV